jgi:8-oxo-dGTP diphosphatase
MRQLGARWHFQTVGAVERGERPLSAYELPALAIALQTSTDVLTLPAPDVREVRFGDQVVPAQRLTFVDDSVSWDGDTIRVAPSAAQYRPLDQRLAALQARDPQLAARLAGYAGEVHHTAPDRPVVAAVVTSRLGVLAAKRRDGQPPWTFIAGEQELGEQPAVTAVREVKEEASLEIRPGRVIGERDHPATGRHMVYLTAKPVRGATRIVVGDEAELEQARWLTLAEVDELMPGVYPPVREYLQQELGRRKPPRK